MARTLGEIHAVIQRYATRLGRLRETLRRHMHDVDHSDDVPFMIPDLTELLPDGPIPLSRWTFQMSAEEYGGVQSESKTDSEAVAEANSDIPSTVEIIVDETHDVDPVPSAILPILRRARADWSGLTWLCWAVGLQRVALPQSSIPPAAFGHAAAMTMERTWRCRDKLQTSGLLALTKGIAGFDWEGTPIDLVPSAFADVALDEYLEARAVFSWLCDTANRSPWQDDLRTVDE
ncbi:MAG: hypothetical protein H7X95_10400 [Deltaproteobacteria bacterium]|nr:hypothetical protein [Deltaproteobacteria bacterium]